MASPVTSAKQLEDTLASSSGSLHVLHFYVPWSDPCKQVNEALDDLARQFPTVKFLKIEAEDNADISEKYEISAAPTIVFVKNNTTVDTLNGANVPELVKKINAHSAISSPLASNGVAAAPPGGAPAGKTLDERLDSLVRQSPMVVFIKGTPAEPRCGFSRSLVTILNDLKADYSFFNILSDEDVRQGLKTKLDWPTYPMVIVNGELVGGLDIVKEMVASGELQTMIPKKE